MKKAIAMVVAATVFCTSMPVMAMKADCLNADGKFSDCDVSTNEGVLIVDFDSKKWDKLDRNIDGKKITGLSSGEYARRRVGESIGSAVLLGPFMLFLLFSKKKRDNFGVEYVNENGNPDAIEIQVKKKYGHALATQLRAISGRDIISEGNEGAKSKRSNVADEKAAVGAEQGDSAVAAVGGKDVARAEGKTEDQVKVKNVADEGGDVKDAQPEAAKESSSD